MTNQLPTTLSDIETNIAVSLDDVVNVFLSKYETNLMDRKKTLSSTLTTMRREQEQLEKSIIDSFDTSIYEVSIPNLQVESKVLSLTIDCDKAHFRIEFNFMGPGKSNTSSHYSHRILVDMEPEDIRSIAQLCESVQATNDELMQVLSDISDLQRKERQIRGKISERKIAESGMSTLLDDPDILSLVKL